MNEWNLTMIKPSDPIINLQQIQGTEIHKLHFENTIVKSRLWKKLIEQMIKLLQQKDLKQRSRNL